MSNENVTNFPRESTIRELVDLQRADLAGKADAAYKEKVAAATTKAEVDDLFVEWWKYQYDQDVYSKADMLPTLVFPKDTVAWTWKYITDNAINDDVLWPEATNASGSGVGVGAGFYCVPAASGVRAAWCFGYLGGGGVAGVPCRFSLHWVGYALWFGSLGAPGLEG